MLNILIRGKFRSPVDRTEVAADWRQRGFSCDLFVDPPGRTWRDFVHQSNELVTVTEGRLQITIGDSTFVAEPGDEVLIPKGVRHSVSNIHQASTQWLYGYG
jgi:mannose-6-phosphate isomerase-like protein (cupin superfamily)